MFYWFILFYPTLFFLKDLRTSLFLFLVFVVIVISSYRRLKRVKKLPKTSRLTVETNLKEQDSRKENLRVQNLQGENCSEEVIMDLKNVLFKMILSFVCALILFCNYTPRVLVSFVEGDEISGYCTYLDEKGFDLYSFYDGQIRKFKIFKRNVDSSFENKLVTVSGFSEKHLLPANRGGFDYDSYLKAYQYYGYLYPRVIEPFDMQLSKENPVFLREGKHNVLSVSQLCFYIKLKLAQMRSDLLRRCSFLDEDSKILVKALLFGEIERSWLSRYSKELGIIHLFVISGMHFSLIAGGFRKICNTFFQGRFHVVEVFYLSFCLAFLWMNSFSVGALRAFLMVLFRSVCFYTKRVYDRRRILILIAGVWSAVNPNILFQSSFQLSFMGTLFIIECSHLKWFKNLNSHVLKSSLTNSVTCILLLPILHVHYLQTHLIAILLLPLITPLVCLSLLLSVLYFPVDFLYDRMSSIFLIQAFRMKMMNIMEELSDLIRNFMEINTALSGDSFSFLYIIALFLSVLLIGFFLLKHFRRDIMLRLDIFLLSLIFSCVVCYHHIDFGFTIRSFALKDGESYLIRWNGSNLVYDVGNDKEVIHCLKRCGVDDIDVLVISHFDLDHCGMLKEILEHFNVKRTIYAPVELRDFRRGIEELKKGKLKGKNIIEALKMLENKEFRVENSKRFFTLNGAKLCYSSLSYESGFLKDKKRAKSLNKNETSIIMSIEYCGKKILLNGDIEQEGMEFQNFLFEEEIQSADILKVPHHGSYREALKAFIENSDPHCYIIAGGRGKRIKKEKTLKLLRKKEIPCYDTNHSGEIFINYRFENWRVVEYKNEL